MDALLSQVRQCTICADYLPLGPHPIVSAHPESKIVIIGQAPGIKVHNSGIAWNDASGKRLRTWLNVNETQFYDTKNFAIIPMGFCYPGKGKSGDLPPRPECAPQWHDAILNKITDVKLIILIGNYAQKYYLKDKVGKNLTDTVSDFESYLPTYFPMPHPSPRNRFWLSKNQWFETSVVPELQKCVQEILQE
ncbi:uracil-DNA glycosylase family protein [Formosa sp. PL04]|uniref:uracil-DNA glycosylase family protein n=1 Tax=Formosa sp. PL04 TaxID=3081755 RepID=UPI00298125AE|nr:uracil-DNA glycosylase family protein [Formosa sp. PL04]MDW5289517.1 uracil-DNA glycosylase family protein [Formosa sp. PL04]